MSNTSTPPAKRNLDTLLARVDHARDQLAAYLPANVEPDRFMALARRAIAENPDIASCTSVSVLRALSNCATSGLPLDGQFSSLVVRRPRKGPPVAVWDATYRGMISMALSSGFVVDVQSFVVRELDEFSVEQGTEPRIVHRPALLRGGRVVAAYAWARLRGGQLVLEVLGAEDIAKIKASSPAGDRGPWGSWEDQMARKSAVRRLLKKLPAAPARTIEWPADVSGETPASPQQAPRIASFTCEKPARRPPPAPLPEDEHALECAALERLRNAGDHAELAAAWAQTVAEHQQAGVTVPAAVTRVYDELRDAGDPEADERDDWLAAYDQAERG